MMKNKHLINFLTSDEQNSESKHRSWNENDTSYVYDISSCSKKSNIEYQNQKSKQIMHFQTAYVWAVNSIYVSSTQLYNKR